MTTDLTFDVNKRPQPAALLPRFAVKAAVDSFLESVGSDEWWLGDIAIGFRSVDDVVLAYPDADGLLMEFAVLGANQDIETPRLIERVLDAIARVGGSRSVSASGALIGARSPLWES